MNGDSRSEMDNLRKTSFGPKYNRIRELLELAAYQERKREFDELEDNFLQLITYVLSTQGADGSWMGGDGLRNVITAHALRHLYQLGIPLSARWNLVGPSDEGNLFRAARLLINHAFKPKGTSAKWGTDVWDDCYIMLALLEVHKALDSPQIAPAGSALKTRFQEQLDTSLAWLKCQFDETGFTNSDIRREAWFGPGFYSAAIKVFAHKAVRERLPEADDLVSKLAGAAGRIIQARSVDGTDPKWYERFAWHAGQLLVTWKEHRESHPALRGLNLQMEALLADLGSRQRPDGVWADVHEKEEYEVYFTVRGLAAYYANARGEELLADQHVKSAHEFLLKKFRENSDGQLVNPKASINALSAFQNLFGFHVHDLFPNLLISAVTRANKLGLLNNLLNPEANDSEILRAIRESARKQLEARGEDAVELLGVNAEIYRSVEKEPGLLKQFTGDHSSDEKERREILEDLRRCLSATLTETRSKLSHRLIMRLWDSDGFLNFKPLIEHLSYLEQDRAFYKLYRDHLNHELLLFLFGAHLYYNCKILREKINDEIESLYEGNITKSVKDDLAGEFLFRWKLISTFHDIGYLFEVDPPEDDVPNEPARTKGELIQTSFNIVDGFRDNFLADYFFNTIPARRSGLDRKATEKAHRDEVTREAETFKKALQPYPGNIRSEADLLTLSTAGQFNTDAFKLISKYVKPPRISGDLIKNYFYLCAAEPVFENGHQIRTAFYDHGIMSALVLLKAADVQRHYLNELSKKEFHGDLFRNSKVRNVLLLKKSENHLDAEQFFIRFSHVAGAIALHNINPTLFSQEQCQDFDIESARQNRSAEKIESNFYPPQPDQTYGISLDENPLSYLTALADTLQDWDRHSFRRLWFTEDSDPLTASELTMGFKDNMMHVRPLTPTATNKYAKLTSAKSMGHLIDWQKYLQIL